MTPKILRIVFLAAVVSTLRPVLAGAGPAAPASAAVTTPAGHRWVTVCLHAHGAPTMTGIADNGEDSPAELVARLQAAGFDAGVLTPHSDYRGALGGSEAAWEAARAASRALSSPVFLFDEGEELEVAHGPAWRDHYDIGGRRLPGNLEHMTMLGGARWVAMGSSIEDGCRVAHDGGGVCIVAHPGPGPLTWEEGYFEAHAAAAGIDGLEVYNGQAYGAAGIDYERLYLAVTASDGPGLRLAAIGAPDTHGADRMVILREKDAPFVRMLATTVPAGDPRGLELDARTLVRVDAAARPGFAGLLDAVRARRTVAAFGIDDLALDCPGLGQVIEGRAAHLHLGTGRPVDRILLYRNGVEVARVERADHLDRDEDVTVPVTYVWAIQDGSVRAMTSGTWYVPPAARR